MSISLQKQLLILESAEVKYLIHKKYFKKKKEISFKFNYL